jgi:serine/threonine protein kinase
MLENDIEKLAVLGKGKFAEVGLYRNKIDDQLFAIKKFLNEELYDKNKILIEFNILKQLQDKSKYIVKLIEYQNNKENPISIEMQAYLGGSLHLHIKHSKNKRLEPRVVRIYFAQLLSALVHLHENQCMHRDIKTNNCVLDSNGNIILCDFGAAKFFEYENENIKENNNFLIEKKNYTIIGK